MAAPIYTQSEVDELLHAAKYVVLDAWERRKLAARAGSPNPTVEVEHSNPDLNARFVIELSRGVHPRDFSVVLKVDIDGRGWQAIARYERQVVAHVNRAPCQPCTVYAFQPHRHLYSEVAVRRRGEWDACAELLDQSLSTGPEILGRFLDDCHIRFEDKDTHQALFDWMNR